MTARSHYEADAGQWVAYRDQPKRRPNPLSPREYVTVPGQTQRVYLWNVRNGTGSTSARDCVRFDTKAEALEAARNRWPRRVKGCRIGAERVVPTCPTCGASCDWVSDQWVCTNAKECGDEWHPDDKRFSVRGWTD